MRMLAAENAIRQALDNFWIRKARHVPRRNSQSAKYQHRKRRIIFAETLLFTPENRQRFILCATPARNSRHRKRIGKVREIISQHFLQHKRIWHRFCKLHRISNYRIHRDCAAQLHRRNHRINQRQVPLAHHQVARTRSQQRIRHFASLRRILRRNRATFKIMPVGAFPVTIQALHHTACIISQ